MEVSVVVAAIGALGLVTQAWVSTTRRSKRIEENLGSKNGQGNAMEILEYLKVAGQRHGEQLNDLTAWQRDHIGRWHQRNN